MRDKTTAGLGQAIPSRIHEVEKCADGGPSAYMPTIEQRLEMMEEQAKYSISCAEKELARVARIRAAIKKNPALSDLYTLMKF